MSARLLTATMAYRRAWKFPLGPVLFSTAQRDPYPRRAHRRSFFTCGPTSPFGNFASASPTEDLPRAWSFRRATTLFQRDKFSGFRPHRRAARAPIFGFRYSGEPGRRLGPPTASSASPTTLPAANPMPRPISSMFRRLFRAGDAPSRINVGHIGIFARRAASTSSGGARFDEGELRP